MRWLKGLWQSGVWGVAALLAVNTAGAFTGVTLGYSWLCIVSAWVLGVPGVAVLTIMDALIK